MASAVMSPASPLWAYSQLVGMEVAEKNTFLEFGGDTEHQRGTRPTRSKSCPQKLQTKSLDFDCEAEQPTGRGLRVWSKAVHGGDPALASTGVTYPDLHPTPRDCGAGDGAEDHFDTGQRLLQMPEVMYPSEKETGKLMPAVTCPSPADMSSIGSRQHAEGSCKPCYFFLHNACEKGENCSHCHMPHVEPKWKRTRAPKHMRNKLKTLVQAVALGEGAGTVPVGIDELAASQPPSRPSATMR